MFPPLNGPVVQLVRTLACHARGRRFEPVPGRQFASVAQSVEQRTENPRVTGSIPVGGTKKSADLAHLVERHLAKVEVASSSLVIRSILILYLLKIQCLRISWHHSQVVRQRSAKPLSPVRVWVVPPLNSIYSVVVMLILTWRRWHGSIAQLGEHLPYKQGVTGSNPVVPTINGPVVQLVRTLACHARGRRFEPVPGRQLASVAQSVEQRTENPRVTGSIPVGGTKKSADLAHLVERHLAKVEVASSSLVIRSSKILYTSYRIFLWPEVFQLFHSCVRQLLKCGCFYCFPNSILDSQRPAFTSRCEFLHRG